MPAAAFVAIGFSAAAAATASTVAIGAAIGAVVGAGVAAIKGGDILKGALWGGLGGAVTAGIGAALSPAVSAVEAGVGSTAADAAVGEGAASFGTEAFTTAGLNAGAEAGASLGADSFLTAGMNSATQGSSGLAGAGQAAGNYLSQNTMNAIQTGKSTLPPPSLLDRAMNFIETKPNTSQILGQSLGGVGKALSDSNSQEKTLEFLLERDRLNDMRKKIDLSGMPKTNLLPLFQRKDSTSAKPETLWRLDPNGNLVKN